MRFARAFNLISLCAFIALSISGNAHSEFRLADLRTVLERNADYVPNAAPRYGGVAKIATYILRFMDSATIKPKLGEELMSIRARWVEAARGTADPDNLELQYRIRLSVFIQMLEAIVNASDDPSKVVAHPTASKKVAAWLKSKVTAEFEPPWLAKQLEAMETILAERSPTPLEIMYFAKLVEDRGTLDAQAARQLHQMMIYYQTQDERHRGAISAVMRDKTYAELMKRTPEGLWSWSELRQDVAALLGPFERSQRLLLLVTQCATNDAA